jgi:hypothetical protein
VKRVGELFGLPLYVDEDMDPCTIEIRSAYGGHPQVAALKKVSHAIRMDPELAAEVEDTPAPEHLRLLRERIDAMREDLECRMNVALRHGATAPPGTATEALEALDLSGVYAPLKAEFAPPSSFVEAMIRDLQKKKGGHNTDE